MQFIGRQIEIGVSLEATRGTAGASVQKSLKYLTTNVREKIDKAEDKSNHNSFFDASNQRITKSWIDGAIAGNLQVDSIGYLLASLIGSPTSITVTGSCKDHTFLLSSSPIHPSLSLFLKDASIQQAVGNGCLVKDIEIDASVDDFVKYTANIVGRKFTANATALASYTANEVDFIGKEITVKLSDTLAGLTGATPLLLKNLKVKASNDSAMDFCLGDINAVDGYSKKFSIDGSFTKNFEDTTFKDLFVGGGAKYMQIIIKGKLIDATNYATLTMTFNKVQITNWQPKGNADDIVTEDIDFKVFYNDTDAKAFEMILRNLTAGYSTGV